MIIPTTFVAMTDAPPYSTGEMRLKGGLKRTAFFPVIGRYAKQYKLHNSYLKPDYITDPLEEYWATRNVAGLWDVTGEEPIEVRGPDALAVMNDLVPRDLTRLRDGRCLYCIMCYDHGGIVEDGVLIRFSRDRFWWVGGPAHAEQWIYAHAVGRDATVTSFLDDIHVASIQGPRSRDILQRVASSDLATVSYYGTGETKLCGVPVLLSRTGYTGELGFDIYVAVPEAAKMFESVWDAGRPDGMKLCGSQALNIRRTEAAIINVGQDFDWRHNPFEVGLGWMVDLNKPSFAGREALVRIREAGIHRRLIGLRLDGATSAAQGDMIRHGTTAVGRVTSAIQSPTLGYPIAMGFVDATAGTPGTGLTIAMAGGDVGAEVVPMPFLDPDRKLAKV